MTHATSIRSAATADETTSSAHSSPLGRGQGEGRNSGKSFQPPLPAARGRQAEVGLVRLANQASCWGSCLLLILGLWLLIRRFGGALVQPLDATGLIAAAVCLSIFSGGLRWGRYGKTRSESRPAGTHQITGVMATVGVLACGVALSLPGSPPGPLLFFWSVVLTTEAAWLAAGRVRGGLRSPPLPGTIGPSAAGEAPGGETAESRIACLPSFSSRTVDVEEHGGELLPPGGSQRITRSHDEAAGEIVAGVVRCDFAPHERQRDIHLAFCPPLKRIPQLSAEQVEGPPARIRVAVVETFGAGLEVKLAALNSEPTSVQIQFFACEEPPAEQAG